MTTYLEIGDFLHESVLTWIYTSLPHGETVLTRINSGKLNFFIKKPAKILAGFWLLSEIRETPFSYTR